MILSLPPQSFLSRIAGRFRSFFAGRAKAEQIPPALAQQQLIFTNAIRAIVGESEIFELKCEFLDDGRGKLTLVTDSRRVCLAWCEVQDAWNEVLEHIANERNQ